MNPLTLSRHRHGPLISCLAQGSKRLADSPHFSVFGLTDDVVVVHDFLPSQIDNNIGGYVTHELLPLLSRARAMLPSPNVDEDDNEQDLFERCVGAIVRSVHPSERSAWHLFYDNTLAALRDERLRLSNGVPDFIAEFRAIYRRVAELVAQVPRRSLFDAATCFGFLPLFLAGETGNGIERPERVAERIVACDLNPALVGLADGYRRHTRVPGVSFVCADVLAPDLGRVLALGPEGADVVTAIHLLEHLSPQETRRVLDNLWALTRRRLIVAVPFEDEPDPRFGHRQAFDFAALTALGENLDGCCQAFTHHGGWLVIDRESGPTFRREVFT